jgi:hypothetical protein
MSTPNNTPEHYEAEHVEEFIDLCASFYDRDRPRAFYPCADRRHIVRAALEVWLSGETGTHLAATLDAVHTVGRVLHRNEWSDVDALPEEIVG